MSASALGAAAAPRAAATADHRSSPTQRRLSPVIVIRIHSAASGLALRSSARRPRLSASSCLDPVGTPGALFLLPERRAGLQIVHQKFRRRESGLAMRRRGRDQHDIVARNQPPIAVDHRDAEQRPARARFLDMALDLGLRHAGIVFQRHRHDAVVAADAGEGRDRADVGAPVRQPRDLGADVEILALDADGQLSLRSSAGRTRSRARPRSPCRASHGCGRSRRGSHSRSRTRRHIPRRARTATRRDPPTVRTLAGGSISSSGLPMRSRTQAK